MAWYRTATISLTNGSTTVTGAGTDFINGTAVGEGLIAPDGRVYEIAAIVSATQLTLGTTYLGSTASGQGYSVMPSQSYIRDLAAQASTLVNSYQGVLTGTGAGKFLDGTVSSPGIQFASDSNTGIRSGGSDILDIVVGGVDKVVVNAAGMNAVLGATTPAAVTATTVSAGTSVATPLLNTSGNLVIDAVGGQTTIKSNGTNVVVVSAAGAAVTGALSASGAITAGGIAVPTISSASTLTNKTIDLTNNTLVMTSAQLAAAITDESGGGSIALTSSPAFTGTPTVPTAPTLTATAQAASTLFVQSEKEYLPSIAKGIHSGAVVKSLIYDTARDSDAGAWRKRCSDKSWYTEALGGTVWLGQQPSETVARAYAGAQGSPELVSNGTFTNDVSGWTSNGSAILAVVGNELQATSTGSSAAGAQQVITGLTIGKTYALSSTSRRGTCTNSVTTTVLGIAGASSNPYTVNGAYTFVFVATSTSHTVQMYITGTETGTTAYFDNISVKVVDPTIDVSNYYFQSTADGKYYRCNGNLSAYSEQFDNAFWARTTPTVTPNTTTSPDGTLTADTLSGATGTDWGATVLQGQVAALASTQYTFSIYYKSLGTTTGAIRLRDQTTGLGAETLITPTSSWQRASITYTTGATAAAIGLIISKTNGDIALWGAQVELGSVAQPYKGATLALPGSQTEVFRGNAREFPEQVAIVAETARVVLYDLTQPGAPMWMVFSANASNFARASAVASVAAMNGKLLVAGNIAFSNIDFIKDGAVILTASGTYTMNGTMVGRNASPAFGAPTSPAIVNAAVNDVAITTLEGAPTDPATGLPVPTIAVATAGGVSVIKDDGTVTNKTYIATAASSAYLTKYGQVWVCFTSAGASGWYYYPDLTTATTLSSVSHHNGAWGAGQNLIGGSDNNFAPRVDAPAIGGTSGLNLLKGTGTKFTATSLLAYITNSYNTGWMVGDIKGAYLADTVAETIVGSGELVTNGGFPIDTSGWTVGNGATLAVVANALTVTNAGATNGYAYQTIATVIGKTYKLFANLKSGNGSSSANVYVGTAAGINNIATVFTTSATAVDMSVDFVATATTTYISALNFATAGLTNTYDNISCKLADPDRSVKNSGLILNGTLTKAAVATGSGLVAYSGFNTSNYLEIPYGSQLDFGTGDFCIMGWLNTATPLADQVIFYRGDDAETANRLMLQISGSGAVAAYLKPAGAWGSATITSPLAAIPASSYNHVTLARSGATLYLYINGVQVATAANSTDLTNTSALTRIGRRTSTLNMPFTGSLSLVRISATAPSADQITHIYKTELPLFQAGAQCTLAGTSTSVTALAYDDVTDVLQVGTSWGRSGFRDLLRVDSEATTTGAITSLSANQGSILTGGASSGRYYQPALLLRDELRRNEEAKRAFGSIPVVASSISKPNQTVFVAGIGQSIKSIYADGVLVPTNTYAITTDGFRETLTLTAGFAYGTSISLFTVRK